MSIYDKNPTVYEYAENARTGTFYIGANDVKTEDKGPNLLVITTWHIAIRGVIFVKYDTYFKPFIRHKK